MAVPPIGSRWLLALCLIPTPGVAQSWGSRAALDLVQRAIVRRASAGPERGLRSYRAQADGVVLFHVWIGQDGATQARLAKADQLSVEVYWQAPNRSKQIITRWRERRYLPTGIRYHRDHLGIATNDFGDRIRLGDGDEVGDVMHPLAPAAPTVYEYALMDSLSLRSGALTLHVYAVQVRPRDPATPAAVGTLYLDRAGAELVRFRFGFTAAAYRQADLASIRVDLENALFEQRHWLPWRQEIEVRRRTAWLDFPIETTIRGRWVLHDYQLDAELPPALFAGGPYAGPPAAQPDTGWSEALDDVVARSAGPVEAGDLDAIRREVSAIVGELALRTSPPARLAFGSLSDVAHVNRVQGLALGTAAKVALGRSRWDLRPALELGTADGRILGGARLGWAGTASRVTFRAERTLRDAGEWRAISRALNSLLSQEAGKDYGDYVLLESADAGLDLRPGGPWRLSASLGVERSRSVATAASPATGTYLPNPALGAGTGAVGRVALEAGGSTGSAALRVEAGAGDRDYLRVSLRAEQYLDLGPGPLLVSLKLGLGSRHLPEYRGFLLGGRGTLVGEDFRRFGGRRGILARVEWKLPVTVPELRIVGPVGTGRTATLAPFFAMGGAWGRLDGAVWDPDGGLRPVLGVASELLFQALRLELGWGLRSRRVTLVADAAPRWWPIL